MTSEETLLRTLLILIAAIVLLPIVVMLLMMPMMGAFAGGHMWGGGMGDGTTVRWFWPLAWLVPLVIVAAVGYLLYRGVRGPLGDRTDPALEELRLAYARGELSEEEFEQRRARLRRED